MPVSYKRSRRNNRPILIDREFAGGVQLVDGDMLEISANGRLQKTSSQTSRVQYIFDGAAQTPAAEDVLPVLDAGLGDSVWTMPIVPVFNDLIGQAGGSTTAAVLNNAVQNYSASDFVGGKLYCKETNEQRTITASTASTNPSTITLTVDKPFSQSTIGKTMRATPLGQNRTACKLVATTFDVISQVIADLSGGNLQCMGVDLAAKTVDLSFA